MGIHYGINPDYNPDPTDFQPKWTVRLERKTADCWVGVYWHSGSWRDAGHSAGRKLEIWVCLIPMVPFHLCRTVKWETCYECGEAIGDRRFQRHGRAGAVHYTCIPE